MGFHSILTGPASRHDREVLAPERIVVLPVVDIHPAPLCDMQVTQVELTECVPCYVPVPLGRRVPGKLFGTSSVHRDVIEDWQKKEENIKLKS